MIFSALLTKNTLAEFWNHPTPPDKELFHAYRMYHLNVTQINGNFYSQVFFPQQKAPPTLLHRQPDLAKESSGRLKTFQTA